MATTQVHFNPYNQLLDESPLAIPVEDAVPDSGVVPVSSIRFYLDETNNALKVKVKYAAGTVKTGSISLT